MTVLRVTTCQADNTVAVTAEIAAELAARLGITIQVVDDLDWPERYAAVVSGAIDMAWICGLPCARYLQDPTVHVQLLAVPVYGAARYAGLPVYFSDVIVRADSPFARVADLTGYHFAVNECDSMSGWQIVRRYLHQTGQRGAFFGRIVETGAHVASVEFVRAGRAAAAAIDSTVWDWLTQEDLALMDELRVIEAVGPSPAPPWIVHRQVAATLRRTLRTTLLQLHHDSTGRAALATGGLARFAPGEGRDYLRLLASIPPDDAAMVC